MKQRKKTTLAIGDEVICRCNQIKREKIEWAISQKGAKTLNEIFDLTTAGVGPCGGSCRKKIALILNENKQNS